MKKYLLLKSLKQVVAFTTLFAVLSNTTLAATYYVNWNSDQDNGSQPSIVCTDGDTVPLHPCTFRDAVNRSVNGDTIRFLNDMDITNSNGVTNGYDITQNNLTIDGTTGSHTVNLDGNAAGGGSAWSLLNVTGTNFTLNGVHIYNFNGSGVGLASGANGANIHDNVIGQNSAGAGTGNGWAGISNNGASGVTIQNNVISNNSKGIFINSLQPTDTTIKGNRIGVDGFLTAGSLNSTGGNTANRNTGSGIEVQGGDFTGGSGLQIGGSLAADRNIISGNYGPALWMRAVNPITGNITVRNNYIGVGKDGSTALGNDDGLSTYGAINSEDGAGTAANWLVKDNVISSNNSGGAPLPGIRIDSGATAIIQGNKIGVNADGTTAAGNSGQGILVDAGTVVIGNDGSGDSTVGNIIANNGGNGVENTGTETNSITIAGNKIGLNSAGAAAGNTGSGIKINSNATTVNIGKVAPIAADGLNTIGNNTSNGVDIVGTGGDSTTPATITIANNHIGTDGTTSYANVGSGVKMEATSGASNVTIGSNGDASGDADERNVIGKNATGGVSLTEGEITLIKAVKNLVVAGNIILGNTPTNGSHGIILNNSTDSILNSVVIGGDDCSTNAHATSNSSVERNYITGINGEAVYSYNLGTANPTTASLTIQCNQIGIKADGSNSANAANGISINDAGAIIIKDNTVSNSTSDAVFMAGGGNTAGTSLEVYGNKFGTAATGLTPAGNGGSGLNISASTLAASGLFPVPVIIGGSTAALANVFAASATAAGIGISGLATSSTPVKIQGNYVGVCADPFGKGTIANGNLSTCKNLNNGIYVATGDVTIGGDAGNNIEADGTLGTGNVVANNDVTGIRLDTSSTTIISGNIMGLIKATIDATYDVAAPNTIESIRVFSGSPTLTIGGTSGANVSSNRNVIATGGGAGIDFRSGSNAIATIINNYINTDWTGTLNMGSGAGVNVSGGSSTITIGGTSANQGNVIAATSTGGSVVTSSGFSGTLNLYKNIFGLNAAGTAALSGSSPLVDISSASATVNVGDGTSDGRNVFGGSTAYAIFIEAATTLNVLGNYIGFAADGTTSIPNATDSAGLIGMGYPVAETYFTAISGALTVSGNTMNNTAHVAAYYKDVIPANESTMTSGNTYSTGINHTAPTYNFWERYVGATLTASGPKACDDGYDNDSDGSIDYPADTGCSSAADTDETNAAAVVVDTGGGGGSYTAPSRTTNNTTTNTTTNTVTDNTQVTSPTDAEIKAATEDQNLRDYIVQQKLNEAINVTKEALLGKDEVNVDLILAPQNDATEVQQEPAKPLTPEQTVVVDALVQLSEGKDLSKAQVSKVEATVNKVLENSVQEVFKKAEASGGTLPAITVASANGKSKTLTKDTKIQFVLDSKKSADIQDLADAKGEDTLVVNPSTVIGDNDVSALLIVMQGGKIGDPLAAEKIFFKGLNGLADGSDQSEVKGKISFAPKMAAAKVSSSSQVTKLEDLLPKKPMLTNMFAGVETAPKFLVWVAGPKAGEKVSVFAVDKVDPKNPKSWKIYKFGQYYLDEGYKAAVEVDLSDKMDKDVKNFTLVVQDEKGVGTTTDIILNKSVTMKLDTLTLVNGDQVKPIDLTKNNDLLAREAKSIAHVAAAKVNSKEKSTVEKKVPEVITVKGYSEPGSVIFVTWKSVLTTSTVIADANGYFEVQVPKQLEKGDHTAYTSSYNKEKKTASNFAKIMFAKFF
ncbi:MAG: hypothetical protein NTZ25_04580 [Candidatus Peregrinibacteria bacterium]|nr:hypothetical protein [Candidatus Peregrinibacteria bacterium]